MTTVIFTKVNGSSSTPGKTQLPEAPSSPTTKKTHALGLKLIRLQFKDTDSKTWKDIDISTLPEASRNELLAKFNQIVTAMHFDRDPGAPMTLTFSRAPMSEPSSFRKKIGHVISGFAYKTPPLQLQEISFQNQGKKQVLKPEEKDLPRITSPLKKVDELTVDIFKDPDQFLPAKKTSRKSSLPLEIQDAVVNTPSTAHAVLAIEKARGTLLGPLTAKYDLSPQVEENKLAQPLIDSAARKIAEHSSFLTPGSSNFPKPGLEALKQALSKTQPTISIDDAQVPNAYAEYIKKENASLGIPFLLALGQPFMVIDDKGAVTISHDVKISDIDTFDLNGIHIFYDNGKGHYQAVIPQDGTTPKKDQETAIRKLVKNQLLGGFNKKLKSVQEQDKLVQDLGELSIIYPHAKAKLIEELKLKLAASASDLDFVKAAQTKLKKI